MIREVLITPTIRCSDSVCHNHDSICQGGTGYSDIIVSTSTQTSPVNQPVTCVDVLSTTESAKVLADPDDIVRSAPLVETMTWAPEPSVRLKWEEDGADEDDLYGCLGVLKSASKTQLKRAWVQGMRELHPDKTGGDSSAGGQLSHAYQILSDDAKRRLYDKYLLEPYKSRIVKKT